MGRWLGWLDLNQRMPESKSGALTSWRHPIKNRVGRATRIELTTSRATIWRSNQLSYTRHKFLVRLKRFELLTHGLEGRCSIHLSYRRIPNYVKRRFSSALQSGAGDGNRTHATSLEGWDSTTELHPHVNHAQRLYILSKIDRDVKRFYVDFIKFFIVFCP